MALNASSRPLGIYTRTVVHSPVILDILHAQIRSRWRNDVVFVAEDFIQVKEVAEDGHLELVARKDDFDGRIRAASVLTNEDDGQVEDFLVKLEKERTGFEASDLPPQTVVLTLDSNDLVFIYLRSKSDGTASFAQQTVPMPCWEYLLYQPGEFLAVDPSSRALAVAANEREVILYDTKPKDQIQREMKSGLDTWCPVSYQRPLAVEGVIHQMSFLMPPADDEDHVVLLLIVTDQRRTKAIRIEWNQLSGSRDAQIHSGQSLELGKQVPSLLIPLPDCSFLLAIGGELTRWRNITSGSATGACFLITPALGPKLPGISANSPVWSAWTRPRRNKAAKRSTDNLYLAREDGYIFWINVSASGSLSSVLAADLKCHIGSAFASIAGEDGPDLLAVAGESSTGSVISIGQWPSIRRLEELSRSETMDPETIELLPDWTSIIDAVSVFETTLDRYRTKPTENIMVTSGRQPFGTITEVRQGIELALSIAVEFDMLRNVTDIWTLPNPSDGSIITVLSMPTMTRLMSVPAAFDDAFELLDSSETLAFDQCHRTIMAGITADDELLQVTENGFCLSNSLFANFEDTWKEQVGNEAAVVAATFVPSLALLILAIRDRESSSLCGYNLSTVGLPRGEVESLRMNLNARSLALCAVAVGDSVVVVVSNDSGEVISMIRQEATGAPAIISRSLITASTGSVVCDSLAILDSITESNKGRRLLVVGGLRDGTLMTFTINLDTEPSVSDVHKIRMGVTSIKLLTVPNDKSSAIAMEATGTYRLTWDGSTAHSLSVESIWVTDKLQPELAQAPIVAYSQIPAATLLSSPAAAESTVMVAGENLLVGRLGRHPTTVPRQISVSGTPNRVLFADSIKSYVCASLYGEVRRLASSKAHAPAEEKRQLWPVIDFIPRKGSHASFSYHMQPGERVHALLQWSYKAESDKTYSFMLIGGSYIRSSGSRRGRVTFLQCTLKNGEVSDARESRKEVLEDEVYALARYDYVTHAVCAGERVYMFRFEPDEARWSQVCQPFKLASAGIHMTAEIDDSGRKVLLISTLRDSVVALRLEDATQGVSEVKAELQVVAMAPRAESLLGHLMLPIDSAPYVGRRIDQFILATSKYGQVIGMEVPKNSAAVSTQRRVGNLVFEAQLPRSITRLLRSPPAERKGAPPDGVVQERIRGIAPDGSIVGVALMDTTLLWRLSWLQRLIEWSPELSPHSYETPTYTMEGRQPGVRTRNMSMPLGNPNDEGGRSMLVNLSTANLNELNDRHVDGDILSRVLYDGGAEAVKNVLRTLAKTQKWIREHVETELASVDEVVTIVRTLDKWI